MGVKLLQFKSHKKNLELESPMDKKLTSKGAKTTPDGEVVDHGDMGDLKYEIYKRGLIKIWKDGASGCFKKDINLFETELLSIDFLKMVDGEQATIKGSGDNDHLAFVKDNGDISIMIKKREFGAVELLKNVLSKGKQKLITSVGKGA